MQSQYETPYQAAAPAMEYVGVGRRFLASLIDGVLLSIVSGIILFVFHSGTASTADGGVSYNASGPGVALVYIIPIVYYIVLEATMGGTLGKRMLGLRIVKLDGSPISWGESIIRNLLRIIDGIGGYLLGAILVWTSPTKQRLGDRVAKTVVVRRR